MQSLNLSPARSVRGDLSVPGDKSISHRYVMFSSLAPGRSVIEHFSSGADVAATIFHCLGIEAHAPIADQQGRPFEVCTGKPIRALLG